MHIAVFFQHYHTPDCPTAARPYALVKALAAHHRVSLIAADADRTHRITHDVDWIPPGVDAHWLHVPYANAMHTGTRLLSYLRYSVQALWQAWHLDRPDVVFGSSTPLTVGVTAALAAHSWKVPWVFEVRDLWPDFPIQMGAVPSRSLQRLLYRLEHWLYRTASHVVAASPDQAAHVRRFVSSPEMVSTVEYGTELDVVDAISADEMAALRARYGLPDKPLVLYAGRFGRANAIPTLIETAGYLANRDDVCFVFVGQGYHEPAVQRAAAHNPVIRWLPPQPRRRALTLFRLADLALVPFIDRPVLATNSPSKLYDSLAAGTPVIVTNPGWTKDLVEAHQCGWFVPPEQPCSLAACIAALLDATKQLRRAGARGAQLAAQRFNRATHMQRLRSTIESVGLAHPPTDIPRHVPG